MDAKLADAYSQCMTYATEAVIRDLKYPLSEDLEGLPFSATLLIDGDALAGLDHDIRVTVKFEKTTLSKNATGTFKELKEKSDAEIQSQEDQKGA